MKRVLSIACLIFSFALVVSLSAQAPTAGMKIVSGMWSLTPDGVGKQTGQGAIYAEQTLP